MRVAYVLTLSYKQRRGIKGLYVGDGHDCAVGYPTEDQTHIFSFLHQVKGIGHGLGQISQILKIKLVLLSVNRN